MNAPTSPVTENVADLDSGITENEFPNGDDLAISRTLDMSRLSEFSEGCCANSRLGRCRLLTPRYRESDSRRPDYSGSTGCRSNRRVGATF
jgi:hypothetical protein